MCLGMNPGLPMYCSESGLVRRTRMKTLYTQAVSAKASTSCGRMWRKIVGSWQIGLGTAMVPPGSASLARWRVCAPPRQHHVRADDWLWRLPQTHARKPSAMSDLDVVAIGIGPVVDVVVGLMPDGAAIAGGCLQPLDVVLGPRAAL